MRPIPQQNDITFEPDFKGYSGYNRNFVHSALTYFKVNNEECQETFSNQVSFGLTRKSKFIHPKFFYNSKGSKLFEKIGELPEYYITRTESKILDAIRKELRKYLLDTYRLVELGSGLSTKTRAILDILTKNHNKVEYFPIDISEILEVSARQLQNEYNNLHIVGIMDSYENGLRFIKKVIGGQKLIVFLGSSIGNFNPDDLDEFLNQAHDCMNDDDLFLIGFDLLKDTEILNAAYNDSQGITAQFNLNLLSRINQEAGANFDLSKFEHVAFFNQKERRIEMYLRSKTSQKVSISKTKLSIPFEKDELVLTEYSYKFTIPQIKQMAKKMGFKPVQIWQDEDNYFALALFSVKS